MSQKSGPAKLSSERIVKDIRRATRKQYSAEEKIRIVLDGLRGEHSIAELCRREGIAESLYYTWSKEFLEAGKWRLAGDIARAETSGEVKESASGSPGAEGGRGRAGPGITEEATERPYHHGDLRRCHRQSRAERGQEETGRGSSACG
jgi:transposase